MRFLNPVIRMLPVLGLIIVPVAWGVDKKGEADNLLAEDGDIRVDDLVLRKVAE